MAQALDVYAVAVGNVGVIGVDNLRDAIECFEIYVKISKSNTTMAGGSDVFLYHNGEIEREYRAPERKEN